MVKPTASKLKLILITHDLAVGGLQQVIVNLCKSINRDIFDVSVLCLRALGDFTEDIEKLGIRVFLLPQKKQGTDYLSFLKVAKLLKQEKIKVIHTHNTQPLIDGTIGALLAGVKTIVHTDHARMFPDKLRYEFAEWVCSHFVYKMVAVSEQTASNLKKFEKISAQKIQVIPNGVYGKSFDVLINKNAKKTELGLPAHGPIIGVCARLDAVKGLTYLLKAMPTLVKSFPDITLVIAGNGPIESDLKQEVVELNIKQNVKFLGVRKDIPELFPLFDCYVMASLSEGLPMVLLEAMAAKCPIVATNVGGIGTVIKHKETGLLIPSKDPNQIYSAIKELLENHELRNSIIKKAFDVFNRDFEVGIMTKQYEKLYLKNSTPSQSMLGL